MGILNNVKKYSDHVGYIKYSNERGPAGRDGRDGIGFKLTDDGNYNLENKKITNLDEGISGTDSINKHQLDTGLNLEIDKSEDSTIGRPEGSKLVRYLSDKGLITPKMYIEDEFGDSVIIKSEDQDYDDVHLHIPNLQNYDGNSDRRKSNFLISSVDNNMTGKIILPSGNLVIKDGNNEVNVNRVDINKIYGSSLSNITTGKVPLYDSNGRLYCDGIKFRYANRSVYLKPNNQNGNNHIFIPNLSGSDRTIMCTSLNQTIQDTQTFQQAIICNTQPSQDNHLSTKLYVDTHSSNSNYLKIDGSNFMTGDLNMNEQKVKNILDPINEQDGVNKRFLEAQLHDYLKTDGQNPMTFDLNINNHIINLRDTTGSSFDSEAVNKKYVDAEIAKIPSANISTFLKKDGTVAMTGDLNMATNKIQNLGTPTPHENDAAINVEFFNSELNASNQNLSTQLTTAYKKYVDESHITPEEHFRENAFRYLMEDADESSSENNISVSGIVRFDASIHKKDKNAYRITLIKDPGS